MKKTVLNTTSGCNIASKDTYFFHYDDYTEYAKRQFYLFY